MNTPAEIKADLLALVAKMNIAAANGIKIEFNINIDPVTLQARLERFVAFQQLKDN